jgi:hypothetical protein
VLHSPRVDNEVLCASISAYLLLGLIWAFGYMLIGLGNPASFVFTNPHAFREVMNARNAFYFSFVTLSTVGYGDIVPRQLDAVPYAGAGQANEICAAVTPCVRQCRRLAVKGMRCREHSR